RRVLLKAGKRSFGGGAAIDCRMRNLSVTGAALVVFFFSSRRRHTRCLSDWSSDVCSSDLARRSHLVEQPGRLLLDERRACSAARSEERRVGKECRPRWSPDPEKKKETTTQEQWYNYPTTTD